jgi:hypothetical protein
MFPNKYKFLSFGCIFLLLVSLIGCVQSKQTTSETKIVKLFGKTVISATVSKVGKNMLDVKPPHISYSQQDSTELQILVDAIQRAEKRPGIADMTSPNYVFTLTFGDKTKATYSLWLFKDGGSIMNENDSYTVYKLPSDLIKELHKIVLTGSSNGMDNKISTVNEDQFIIVQKHIGKEYESNFEEFRKITVGEHVLKVKEILDELKWVYAKRDTLQPPDYQFVFQPKDPKIKAEALLYKVWVTPDKDRLVMVRGEDQYAQLSKKQSAVLFEILTGEKLAK